MRSYGQCCALAKALDVIGDRWTLLIVRELLIRDGCRYTDLKNGLPGIATNLLAERLSEMENAGLVVKEAAPPPVATSLFRLTRRGRDLEPVIATLGRWGAPLLRNSPADEVFCDHWIVLPLRLYARDLAPAHHPVTIAIIAGDEPLTLATTGGGGVSVEPGHPQRPDARIEGPAYSILALLTGRVTLARAHELGLSIEGDIRAIRRFQEVPTDLA